MRMRNIQEWLDYLDLSIVRWLARLSLPFLRFGLGVAFLWFGALKFFPDCSSSNFPMRLR